MQGPTGDKIRTAVTALLQAALRDLAERDGAPKVGPMADNRSWRRYGQASFVALHPNAWHLPDRVAKFGWLNTFSEMAAVRDIVDADPVLSTRLDTMVGTEFSLSSRRLDWLLIEHLLEPMIISTGTYDFDDAVFKHHFNRLDAGLRADVVRMVEFVPLNAFTSSMLDIPLPDGVVLRPMTDCQISRAIQVLAVPTEFGSSPNSVELSRFHQWAVMREQGYAITSYREEMPEQPQGPDFPRLEEPAQRLVTGLRIVGGGSVVATRPIHIQHDDDFPPTVDGSALLSTVAASDINRPTMLLTPQQVEAVRDVYDMLATLAVQEDRSLQVALRWFVFAGSQVRPEDRLIELIICCEALFLKRNGVRGKQKGAPVSVNAGRLLENDPVIKVGRIQVERFVKTAYRLRNSAVHGDHPVRRSMTLLHGARTEDLARFIDDLSLVVGRALHLVLDEVAHPIATAGGNR